MRLYSTFLKTDASLNRSGIMLAAWAAARKEQAAFGGSVRECFRLHLSALLQRAADARHLVLNDTPSGRQLSGYGHLDRDAEFEAAAPVRRAA